MNKSIVAGMALSLLAGAAMADANVSKGDYIARVGVSNVDPDSDGLKLQGEGGTSTVRAEDATMLTFNGTYMVTNNIGVELLASLPFQHDIELDGSKVGETKQLPPTLSVQWHFPIGQFKPYVGAGLNYTIFFDQSTTGALDGADLDLDNSLGVAGQVGVDWFIDGNWLVNLDVRYIDIDTDAKLNGDKLGSVDIDPWIYGLHVGYKF